MPRVSVLLPVRDAAPWLAAALTSLRRQTFADFEIVAVDDGSRDASPELLARAAADDPRLRVVRTAARGLPSALATALEHARGEWIARQDADDLSHRRRFELQVEWLRGHPGDAIVGTRARLFPRGVAGEGMTRWIGWHNRLRTHESMAAEALIDNPLLHGTAMMRRTWLDRAGGWRERGWPEDLDLSLRLLAIGARFAKLPGTLYGWRQHSASATRRDPRYAPERFLELKREALRTGFLRDRRRVHLVGTGRSLERWRTALAALPIEIVAHERRTPAPIPRAEPPFVLVYGVAAVRERWRGALLASDMQELRDFMFVS